VLAIIVLDAGYTFVGVFRQLGSFTFVSNAFAGATVADGQSGGNRFATSWAGSLPVPIPEDYLIGIDLQRFDFEQGLPSYLHGQWADHGWWYYYLYALGIKLPLGCWMLVLLAITSTACRAGVSASCRDEWFLLVPLIAIVGFVSSQTGFSVHSR